MKLPYRNDDHYCVLSNKCFLGVCKEIAVIVPLWVSYLMTATL